MVQPFPAPSLRELSSECETEGVYPDERKRSKISEFIMAGGQTIGPVEPSDDTPSASLRSAAPSEREPGNVPIQRAAQKPQRCGRFSSPLRNSENLTCTIHRTTLPQSRPVGRDSSLREGAGNAIVRPDAIQRAAQKPQGCGRFSSPLRNSECLTVPIHWREQKFLVFSYVSCVIRQIVVKWGKIYPAAPAGGG